jgi:hypothetical protein
MAKLAKKIRRSAHLLVCCCVLLSVTDIFVACDALEVDLDDCTLPCDSPCPSGFQCVNGYCAHSGSRRTCSAEGGLSEMGTGGGPGTGGVPGGGTAGAPDTPGGESGGGMDSGIVDGASPIIIGQLPSAALCAGSPGSIGLTASGGTPPFVWSLDEASFQIERTGAKVQVTGTPLRKGTYTLHVTVKDAHDRYAHASLSVEVFERPRITTTTVPPACVGQPYRTKLEAAGGDPESYRFSVEAPAQSTLATDGSSLTCNPSEPGSTPFTVTVTDAHCASDPVSLTLKADAASCPTFKAATLPAPCKGQPYPAQIVDVVGGTGPYTLTAPSLPSGFAFDGDDRILKSVSSVSGVSLSEDPLVLRVEDGAGHVTQQTFSMTARDSCWLAYRITPTNAPSTLHLHDPVLGTDLEFPLARWSESVVDYKFSPNGRFLAYRLQSQAGSSRLVVISAPLWTESALNTGEDATHYEWSPDSSILAVSYRVGDTIFLGGVRAVSDESPPEADGGTVEDGGTAVVETPQLTTLEPLPASVGSDLVWAGNRAVEFHSGSQEADHTLYYAKLGAQGFDFTDTAEPLLVFAPDVVLRAPTGPLVAIQPKYDMTSYGAFDGTGPVRTFLDGTLDPQGHYVATTSAGELDLFELTRDPDVVWASTQGCTALLAWAPNQERLACLSPSDTGDTVRVLDVRLDPPSIVPNPGTISGDYAYLAGDAFERRRAFSENAKWFAFTTTQTVYAAKLYEGSPFVYAKDAPLGVTFDGPTDLAFSPDDHWLLAQRGTEVHLLDLTGARSIPILIAPYTPPGAKPCSEKFLDDPDTWCGNTRPSSSFIWSPDSQYVAARDGKGKISRLHIEADGSTQNWQEVCDQDCSEDFTYQPSNSTLQSSTLSN